MKKTILALVMLLAAAGTILAEEELNIKSNKVINKDLAKLTRAEDITPEKKEVTKDVSCVIRATTKRHPNGKFKEVVYYFEGREIAKTTYDAQGNKKTEGIIPNGLVKEYYQNGNLMMKAVFIGDKVEGMLNSYYENGQLMTAWNFKDNKQDGLCLTYDKTGKLKEEGYYKAGKRNGLYRLYNANGTIKGEGIYEADRRNGIERLYDENGKVLVENNYKGGIKNGLTINYYGSGKIKGKSLFRDGSIKGYILFYEDGKLLEEKGEKIP